MDEASFFKIILLKVLPRRRENQMSRYRKDRSFDFM
jgi:hypothetical protein